MSDRNQEHHDENPNLDPNAHDDNDLDAGGQVKPGHTPPESQSASATPPHRPSPKPPRHTPILIISGVLLALIVFFFVAYGIGLWD